MEPLEKPAATFAQLVQQARSGSEAAAGSLFENCRGYLLAIANDRLHDMLQAKLGDNYIVALNLLSSSPHWLASIGALPMYLGLDLRGGVHFLLQVDMKGALDKAADRWEEAQSFLQSEFGGP